MPAIRVLIVDDMRIVREALARMLHGVPDFQIVGQAEDGRRAVALAAELRPDVVLMDVNMPRMNGVDATREIAVCCPSVKVIGLSMHEGEWATAQMLNAGAVAYLTKDSPLDVLVEAIRAA